MDHVWYGDINVQTTDSSSLANVAKNILWLIKQLLTGAASGTNGGSAPPVGSRWTVVGSSDGVTGAMDSTDRWGAVSFDATKIIRAAANGTAHSWICLKSPDALGPVYLCISYIAANDYSIQITGSKVLPTSGSNLNDPTYTQSWVNGPIQFMDSSNVQLYNLHRITNADGSFYLWGSRVGSGVINLAIQAVKLAETRSTDNYPVFVYVGGSSAGSSVLRTSNVSHTSTGAGVGTWKGRSISNGAIMECVLVVPALGGSSYFVTYNTGSDFVDGLYSRVPPFVAQISSSAYGIRGRLPDVLCGATNTGQGNVQRTPGGVIERVFIGDFWWPWINATPTL